MTGQTQLRSAELAPGAVLDPYGRIAVVEKDSSGRAFDPGKPPDPRMPRGSPPRQWTPGISDNLGMAPRQERGRRLTPFETLRALRSFDLVNIAVEDLRGQVLGMEWDIVPRRQYVREAKQLEKVVDEARRWIEMPDPGDDIDYETFVTKVIDEMVTTDALSIWPAVDVMDRPIGMWLLDGTTIKPVRDILGRKPQPPEAAYYQYVHGQVETVFELPQLWYLPKNQQTASSYGTPPVEMLLLTINSSIRKSLEDLEYLRSGTVPSSMYALPEGWTREQVIEFGEWWQRALKGNVEGKFLLQFLPGGGKYISTKDRPWTYDYVEWLMRLICGIFGINPSPFAKTMNRATSETLETSTMESGVRPYARFVARVFNRFIQRHLSRLNPEMAKLLFHYAEDEVEAAADVRARHEMLLRNGAKTVNELREDNGADRYEQLPAADRPFIATGTGLVFLDEIGEPKPPDASGDPAGDEEDPDGDGEELETLAAERADLKRWLSAACTLVKKGKRPDSRVFRSDAIPAQVRFVLEAALERARTVDEVREAFSHPLVSSRLRRSSPRPSAGQSGGSET